MSEEVETKKRRGRGLGKTPALVSTSVRLSKEVLDYFNNNFPMSKQAKMREVLAEYVRNQTGVKNGTN
jgi:uncharacterized protein (DUF4415 family)